jgi:hypothetical protein
MKKGPWDSDDGDGWMDGRADGNAAPRTELTEHRSHPYLAGIRSTRVLQTWGGNGG